MRATQLAVCAALLTMVCAGSAAADMVMIDSFADQFPHRAYFLNGAYPMAGRFLMVGTGVDAGTQVTAQQDGLAGVLGGQRDATLTADLSQPAASNMAQILDSHLGHVTPLGNMSSRLVLEYGNRTSMNSDWSRFAFPHLIFEVSASTFDGRSPAVLAPVTLTLTSGKGTGSQATDSIVASIIGEGEYMVSLVGMSGIDFSDIDTVTVDMNYHGIDSANIYIEDLLVAPEPATMGLVGIGLFWMATRRRR